jgi:hypothetical protein
LHRNSELLRCAVKIIYTLALKKAFDNHLRLPYSTYMNTKPTPVTPEDWERYCNQLIDAQEAQLSELGYEGEYRSERIAREAK